MAQRKSFDGNLQVAWDSTSLKAFRKCARYYQYTIVEGWRPKKESPHLTFGILYHYALELMDHFAVQGPLQDEHLREILRKTMESAGRTDENGIFHPWRSDHPEKNLESLIRSVIYYFEQFKDDPIKVIQLADGKPAVELSFRFKMPYKNFIYCGHLDKLAEFSEQKYFVDRKTTKSQLDNKFFGQFIPDSQFAGYTVAAKVIFNEKIVGGIVDGAQIGGTFTRFARRPIHFSDQLLDEWIKDVSLDMQLAEQYAELNHYPMNDTACHQYGGCPFREICALAPKTRPAFLKTHFKIEKWDPLAEKGISA